MKLSLTCHTFFFKCTFVIICIPYLSWSHINITLLIIGWMKYSSKKYYYKYRKQLVKKKYTYSLKAFDIKPNVNNNCLLTEFSTTHYFSKLSRVKKIETESCISQNQDSNTIFLKIKDINFFCLSKLLFFSV